MATDKGGADPIHLEAYGGLERLKDVGLHDATLAGGAFEGAAQEHSMGVWQALKTYKRAAFWSVGKSSKLDGAIHSPQLTLWYSDINYRYHGRL